MKIIIIILTTTLLISCNIKRKQSEFNKQGAFYINKNKSTVEIYSNKGELILEFTPQNTDSASLETLSYIYDTVIEYYDRELPAESPTTEIKSKRI